MTNGKMLEDFEIWLNADAERQTASVKLIAEWLNVWVDSRAALCVELPKEVAAGRWADDVGYFKDDIIEAIESQGVRTK